MSEKEIPLHISNPELVGTPLHEPDYEESDSYFAASGQPDPNDGVIVSSSGFKRFADLVDIWYPTPAYVNHDIDYAKYTGYYMPIGNQQFGPCCTAFSMIDAFKMAHGVAAVRNPKPWVPVLNPSIPHLYSLSRCNLSGGKVVPTTEYKGKDGSSQSAAAIAAKEIGLVPCAKYPWADLTYYDPQMCTSFVSAARPRPWARFGVPPASLKLCKKLDLDVFYTYTEQEAMSALAHGFVLGFSTNWYFYQTSADGIISQHMLLNNVGHAMSVQGYLKVTGKDNLFCVRNQMGTSFFRGGNNKLFPIRGTGLTTFNQMKWNIKQKAFQMIAVGKLSNVNPLALRKK